MKKGICGLLCAILIYWTGGLKAQSISGAEYFFDHDPGPGKAVALSVGSNDFKADVPLGSLSEGVHFLYMRVKSNTNVWSIAVGQAFFVAHPKRSLTGVEYFFDKDPGPGLGKALTVSSGDSVVSLLQLNIGTLAAGIHQLYLRTKDADGRWSIAGNQSLFVDAARKDSIVPIVSAEYFIGDDPGVGKGTSINLTSGDSVTINYDYIASKLAFGSYLIGIRVKNQAGDWSIVSSKKFVVCQTYGPKAAFEIVQDNGQVSFLNRGNYATHWQWDLNASDTSTAKNWYRRLSPGDYQVQLIGINSCGTDTSSKDFAVGGLGTVLPGRGGNIGKVTVHVQGYGFTSGTKLKFYQQAKVIPQDTVVYIDSHEITVVLNLNGAAIGTYDLDAQTAGLPLVTEKGAFTVEEGRKSPPVISINAPPIVRRGRQTRIYINVTNTSNIDAFGIPVIIAGIPLGTPVFLPFDTAHLDNGVPHRPFILDDSASGERVIPFIIPAMKPNETMEIPVDVVPDKPFRPTGSVGPPLIDNNSMLYEECEHCVKSLMTSKTIDAIVDVLKIATAYEETGECISSSYGTFYKFLETYEKHLYKQSLSAKYGFAPEPKISYNDVMMDAASAAISCLSIPVFILGTPERLVYKIAHNAYQIMRNVKKGNDFLEDLETAYEVGQCAVTCLFAGMAYFDINVLEAFDPNIKTGPGYANGSYINLDKPAEYRISFENAPQATLPANTVLIRDTIDAKQFELGTINFLDARVGNHKVKLSQQGMTAIGDLSTRKESGYDTRINVRMDTVTGVLESQFQTIDTLTSLETLNDLGGFLPPNDSTHRGEGQIQFVLQPKRTVTGGTILQNRASIIFDNNLPILTGFWKNTLDLTAPISKVGSLADTLHTDSIAVQWAGTDAASGIWYYDVYVSENDSTYLLWKHATAQTGDTFPARYGNSYRFYSQATDRAGNKESVKKVADASTYIESSHAYVFIGNGLYSDAKQWAQGRKAPAIIPAGYTVIVDPKGHGTCIFDFSVKVQKGGKLILKRYNKVQSK